ncbi:MAG: head-tail connector protein [Pseudomonadota bacterium]
MTTAILTPPAGPVLALSDIKQHLRIDHDHEDAYLGQLLKAATQYAEFACGQKLLTQTWRQYETCWPVGGMLVPRIAPVQSVNAITVFNRDGDPQVLPSESAMIERGAHGLRIRLPETQAETTAANGLEIDLVVGFGDLAIDVPEPLRHAIMMLIAHWYEFRGAVAPKDQPVSLPPGFEQLIRAHREVRL